MPNKTEYTEQVMDYLEYLGYPDYVTEFEIFPVAKAIAETVKELSPIVSFRFCALVVFGCTLYYQVPLITTRATKH